MKRNAVIIMSVLAFSVGFAQQKKTLKDVSIYTTAKNQTEKFVHSKGSFQNFPQPKETDICVFVDPDFNPNSAIEKKSILVF